MNDTTTKQLQQAQRLIKGKRYVQARRLLVTIDHPKARQWLEKLDKVAPVKALGSRDIVGWLRDHILIAGILALGVLVISLLSGQVLLRTAGVGGEKCDAQTVTSWWQEQEITVQDFLNDIEGARSAMGDNLVALSVEMQETRGTFAASPVPECADARIFGGYEQILDNMDIIFATIDDYLNDELLQMEYSNQLQTARSEIANGGRRAIRDVLNFTFD